MRKEANLGHQGFTPIGDRGFTPIGDRGFTPIGDRGFTPIGDRGFTLIRDRGFTPIGDRGFTLIEILVVIVILGILAGFIAPRIMGKPEEARRTKAALQIRGIEAALKMYRLDTSMYPTTEQSLDALVNKPETGIVPKKWREGGYLESAKVPLDPWGTPFVYLCPGEHGDFDLSSYGRDGEKGGEGDDADINNWEIE